MLSRILAGILLAILPIDSAAQMGGHRLEFAFGADWVDFDDDIRFEDGIQSSLAILAEVFPGATLGLELNHAAVRDRERDEFVDVFTAALRGRAEPWSRARLGLGAVMGVSFLAFENEPSIDSVSEGFELGPSLRLNLDSAWRIRGEWIWRIQTVSRVRVDDQGLPSGRQEETGYLWSAVARVGVAVAF
jgi:hypothetical protein